MYFMYIVACSSVYSFDTNNKNIHFEMILDVGIGEKRKETRFSFEESNSYINIWKSVIGLTYILKPSFRCRYVQ